MKSVITISVSAAAISGAFAATAPQRMRNHLNEHISNGNAVVVNSEEVYDPFLGLPEKKNEQEIRKLQLSMPSTGALTPAPTPAKTGEDGGVGTPAEGELVNVGDEGEPADAFPLGRCEGDCDEDDDCAEDLVCFKRDDFEEVYGCSGAGESGTDYCYEPDPNATPSPTYGNTIPTYSPTASPAGEASFAKVAAAENAASISGSDVGVVTALLLGAATGVWANMN